MAKTTKPPRVPQSAGVSREQIAARAYQIWLAKGGGHGHREDDWHEAERELQPHAVLLSSIGANKIGVIKELRVITGLDLEAARRMAEEAPQLVTERATGPEAESIRQRLTAVGATVEVR